MMYRLFKEAPRKRIASALLCLLVAQLLLPCVSHALTSGPVQPEAQGFEPVGTTDMVDPFTGDFVYNIPLLDVEGYPINISYHGGVNMEQEASWVGLGWNINPGAANRAIRGLPDDFDGEVVEKEFYMKPDKTVRVGLSASAELVGLGGPVIETNLGASLGGYLTLNNYRGVSVDFSAGVNASANINLGLVEVGLGANVGAGIGSQTGGSINYGSQIGAGLKAGANSDINLGAFNLNANGVYSPRTAIRRNVGFGTSFYTQNPNSDKAILSTGTQVPIGLQNQVASIPNPCYTNTYSGQIKLGGELWLIYLNGTINGSYTKTQFKVPAHRKSYGYRYLPDANDDDTSLLDFTREKDGMWNPTMKNLPLSHLTYDVYSITGQGTGGSFRPFRNDIGAVYDPASSTGTESDDFGLEVGLGNIFSLGGEFKNVKSSMKAGPWTDYKRPFVRPAQTGPYEDVYYKEAGELTENNEDYLDGVGNNTILTPNDVGNIPLTKLNADKRVVRANHIYTITGKAIDTAMILDTKGLVSYEDTTGFRDFPVVHTQTIQRGTPGAAPLDRKQHHVTEIVQTQKDGRRYVYGLPVMNNVQREATFAVKPDSVKNNVWNSYLVGYTNLDDKVENGNQTDHFYSSSVTPSYTSAHLLTGVLSTDYVDVSGDGITDDDLGTYTKFNYTRKSNDYRWRSPAKSGKAQFIPGYLTDKQDDKGAYVAGSRETWMLHSIVTKNYVAEFFVSQRLDAKGVLDAILGNNTNNTQHYTDIKYRTPGLEQDSKSYKLDSIVLYNKHDRFAHGANAQPIKSVHFGYDYSLCKGVPNSTDSLGKLTLKSIQIRYGSSDISMSAMYGFHYDDDYNYNYDPALKDRWGSYKVPAAAQNNMEFPFTAQSPETDEWAKAWSLDKITLPSGGVIRVDYEADDYAFVQNMEAMEMFRVIGFGNGPGFSGGNQLYFSPSQQNDYIYFQRRSQDELPGLSMKDCYLKGTSLLCYNIPVELANGKTEPIKGYAEALEVGACPGTTDKGYIRLKKQPLAQGPAGAGTDDANPIVVTALNVGRYSLPHIMFPGSDPNSDDITNIIAGLNSALQDLFHVAQNPIEYYMTKGKGKWADLSRSYVRLTSPGRNKKGGGQRVKAIKFYDNWAAMAGGNNATYGKVYDYTMPLDDGGAVISSGVASWEPATGSDELPQRHPDPYTVQEGTTFPPNDPVDLFQEMPLGESFFPAPVVGYRKVTVRSINADRGRSSQSEDVHYFYTAKDFPFESTASAIQTEGDQDINITDAHYTRWAKQGFSVKLNDMHGKPMNTEHWILKTDTSGVSRELISFQKNEYLTQGGQLSNMVPTFDYNAGAGTMTKVDRKMGLETDVTIDSRAKSESTRTWDVSANLNGSLFSIIPAVIPLGYGFPYSSKSDFSMATVTKVMQQYGILSKVTTYNQGANTELHNEVFDVHTGNALVTSINNEFGDRQYTASYPAYWAYKEMGPAYEHQNMWSKVDQPIIVDTFGEYADRFINYNPSYSTRYKLPSNMPVGRTVVDENMPKYRLGDEMLMYLNDVEAAPLRLWVMGYTSDTAHCYAVFAPREPYKHQTGWYGGTANTIPANKLYRIARSGYRNRLGETIQSYTTTDNSNIFPGLGNDLKSLVSFTAQRYNHVLAQVYAANTVTDSLNPFVTGKVGIYRPEQSIINVKKRDYTAATNRSIGLFSSAAYWKVEKDNNPVYCGDTSIPCTVYESFTMATHGNNQLDLTIVPVGACAVQGSNWYVDIWNANGNTNSYNSFPSSTNQIALTVDLPSGCSNNAPYNLVVEINGGCCKMFLNVAYHNGHFYFSPHPYTPPLVPINAIDVYSPAYGPILIPDGTLKVTKKIELGKVGYYDGTDDENWIATNHTTKYNWYGQEIENLEKGIGYNSAVYGYDQQLPICVAKNARHGEALFEGMEDYKLVRPSPIAWEYYRQLYYSPLGPLMNTTQALGAQPYAISTLLPPTGYAFELTEAAAHSGYYSLKAAGSVALPLNGLMPGMARGYSFRMQDSTRYVASIWLKPTVDPGGSFTGSGYGGSVSITMDTTLGAASSMIQTVNLQPSSNIIDGWQQYELTFNAPAGYQNFILNLKGGYYYDDLRIYPFTSNSKGFVYHPVTRKLMATLDENNFATFYEYDQEGNLIRTKKETEAGILTISETRRTHQKAQ